jgi:hypothetical protein
MKKPEIKINFLYYGSPFDLKNNLMIKLLKKKYKIIISNKPDYVFFSVYKEQNKFLLENGTENSKELKKQKENLLKGIYRTLLKRNFMKEIVWFLRERKLLRPYSRILDVKGNFVKIFYTFENIKPDMSKCDWAFALCPESELNHPRYMRIPHYMNDGEEFYLRKRKRSFNKIKKEKTKFCNFIYRNHIPPRNKFFKKLSKYKWIDSPGTCMNNMPPIGFHKSTGESRGSGNWVKDKLEFLKPYKFTIAFENTIRDGYNTDRISHSLIANSIPIYIGDRTIGRDFNTKSFINGNRCKNFDEIIKKVTEIDNNDKLYEEMLNQPWHNGKNPAILLIKKIEERFKEIFGK